MGISLELPGQIQSFEDFQPFCIIGGSIIPVETVANSESGKIAHAYFDPTERTRGVEDIFGRSTEEMFRLLYPDKEESLAITRKYTSELGIEMNEEEALSLLRKDHEERVKQRVIFTRGIEGKLQLLKCYKTATQTTFIDEINTLADELERLTVLTTNVDQDPLEDQSYLLSLKNRYLDISSKISALAISRERVSRVIDDQNPTHVGRFQEWFNKRTGIIEAKFTRALSTYGRNMAPTFNHLLAAQATNEYGLPYYLSRVELGSSAMTLFAELARGLERNHCDCILTKGMYFEVEDLVSELFGEQSITNPEELTNKVDEELKDITKPSPIAIFTQPHSGTPDIADPEIKRLIDIIKGSKTHRPIFLVVDTSMVGPSYNLFAELKTLIEMEDRDITLIQIQSLVKHGQAGLDHVTAGLGIMYGKRTEVLNGIGNSGGYLQNYSASFLLPLDAETQAHRIQVAGRNARVIENIVGNKIRQNPLFSIDTSKREEETGINRPFCFIKSTLPYDYQKLRNSLRGFPGAGNSTSYGFDGTRIETIPADDVWIRIAGGQESILQAIAIGTKIAEDLNGYDIKQTSRREIRSAEAAVDASYEALPHLIEEATNTITLDYIGVSTSFSLQSRLAEVIGKQIELFHVLEQVAEVPDVLSYLELSESEMREHVADINQLRTGLIHLALLDNDIRREIGKLFGWQFFSSEQNQEMIYNRAKSILFSRGVTSIVGSTLRRDIIDIIKRHKRELENAIETRIPAHWFNL